MPVGVAAVVVGFPFDTGNVGSPSARFVTYCLSVKVRYQAAAASRNYRSTFHALLTILREERLGGLYRGVFAPIVSRCSGDFRSVHSMFYQLGAAPLNGLVFSSYGLFTKLQLENPQATPTLTQVTLAGAGTGIVCSYVVSTLLPDFSCVHHQRMLRLITSPAELIKTQQQLMQAAASSAGVLSSSSDLSAYAVTRWILRDYGIRGLFRGITSTALRDIGYGTYFGAYEATVRYWPRTPTQKATGTTPWLATLAAGGLAGIAGWVVTFPFDVIKTRVQSTFSKSPANPYRNTWSTTVASYRAEGVQGFFRGLAPTLIRSVLRSSYFCTNYY